MVVSESEGMVHRRLKDRLSLLNLNWMSYEDILEQEFGLVDLDLTDVKWKGNNDIKCIINEIYNHDTNKVPAKKDIKAWENNYLHK